jgi:hypothetical protein
MGHYTVMTTRIACNRMIQTVIRTQPGIIPRLERTRQKRPWLRISDIPDGYICNNLITIPPQPKVICPIQWNEGRLRSDGCEAANRVSIPSPIRQRRKDRREETDAYRPAVNRVRQKRPPPLSPR